MLGSVGTRLAALRSPQADDPALARCVRALPDALAPFLTSNWGHVRTVAQYFFHELMAPRMATRAETETETSSAADAPCSVLGQLFDYVHAHPELSKMRAKQHAYFAAFDPLFRCSLRGLLSHDDPSAGLLPPPLLELVNARVTEHLSAIRVAYDDEKEGMASGPNFRQESHAKPSPLSLVDPETRGSNRECLNPTSAAANTSTSGAAACHDAVADAMALSTNFQRKLDISRVPLAEMQAYLHDALSASELDASQRERDRLVQRAGDSLHRQPLVCVASLVDKPPNLGGLCRTMEIFHAQQLVVGDLAVTTDPVFKRISVTAHKWVALREVKPDVKSVREYLLQLKQEGYTVIALEQTPNSVGLESFAFPDKVALLLGKEKEGVPIELLNLVDVCVEIPQFGIIRSLNVHVSAALLIWEYTRQRLVGGRMAQP